MNVSIIIPTRNRAVVLKKCLQRLVGQVNKNDEVLVIDNGSQDNTKKIVLGFQDKLPVKYLFEPRRGSSFARNLGIKKARGEILGFLDDDMLVDKNWVKVVKKVSREKNLVFTGKIKHVFDKKNVFSEAFFLRHKIDWILAKKLSYERVKVWQVVPFLDSGNFCLRKSVISNLEYPFNTKLFPFIGEQLDLAERLQLAGFKIIYQPDLVTFHQKGIRNLRELIADDIYWGQAQGILQEKYGAPSKVVKLFKNQKESLSLRQILELAHREASLSVFFVFLLELGFFSLGQILGRFSYKIKYRE